MYIMNKYLLLSTPNKNFFYWVLEAFKFFNPILGAAGSKLLSSAGLKSRFRFSIQFNILFEDAL
jgi:hypothetical protein